MNADNLNHLLDVFVEQLSELVKSDPKSYAFGLADIPAIRERYRIGLEKGTYSQEGRAMRAACKKIGIKSTRSAIDAYIERLK